MKIIVPQKVKESILSIGNKTAQKNAYKIYAALYKREIRKNRQNYFDVPSTYLESINSRYNRTINRFIKDGIIKYFEREHQGEDIFIPIFKKYYNKNLGICMKYKFLIDITQGEIYEIDMDNPNKKRWYEITKETLINLGYENFIISRDSFGRRIHHPAIYDYKIYLKDKGLSIIDAKCSQPRLLYLLMKKRGIIENNYFNIFEKDEDFYSYLVDKLNLDGTITKEGPRSDAKKLFMFWVNGEGYVPNFNIHKLFPITSQFIQNLKNKNYKDCGAYLQREEARIWIDDLLENIPTEFALSIHDSLIIRIKDVNKILNYCRDKYPQIKFDLKEL
jgi:hypothetical protein